MVFLAEWLVHVFGLPKVAGIGRVVVLSYLILYLTVVRPLAWRYAKTAS
jgi:hypothetical protein